MAPSGPSRRDRFRFVLAGAGLASTLVMASALAASPAAPDAGLSHGSGTLSPGRGFIETDGTSLYANICQGCHMRDGGGAIGAGAYPSLAADPNLQSPAFVTAVVLDGLKEMPAFGRSLTDDQVAAVVNYVRTHFGNTADEAVTTTSVKAMRK